MKSTIIQNAHIITGVFLGGNFIACAYPAYTDSRVFYRMDVSPKDRHQIKDGAIFVWRRGLEDTPGGQRQRVSELIFPTIESGQVKQTDDVLKKLFNEMRKYVAEKEALVEEINKRDRLIEATGKIARSVSYQSNPMDYVTAIGKITDLLDEKDN